MAASFQVTFDCADPEGVSKFWSALLGYVQQPPPEGYDLWEDWLRAMGIPEDDWNSAGAAVDPDGEGPRLYFQRVPEAKVAKNRVHLDVNVGGGKGMPLEQRRARVESEARRAISLGARELYRVEERGEFHITLQDPEGNEFCLQ